MAESPTTDRATADRGQTSRGATVRTDQENRISTSNESEARDTSRSQERGTGDTGEGFLSRVRDRAGERLSTQKDRASDTISVIARAVRQSSDSLRQDNPTVADYVQRAADQLEQMGTRFRDKDAGELLRSAQNFSRRNPALFIGSAFAIGLVGARFLRSSPPSSDSTRPTSWRRGPGGDQIGPSGDPAGLGVLQSRSYVRVEDRATSGTSPGAKTTGGGAQREPR